MKTQLVGVVVCMLVFATVIPTVAVSTNTRDVDWWSMFRHDTNHTGFSTSTGPEKNSIIWSRSLGWKISASPTVNENNVYIGAEYSKLHCLDTLTGNLLWEYPEGNPRYWSSASVDGQNLYISYIHDNVEYVSCMDAATGDEFWNRELGSGNVLYFISSPTVVDGKIYLGSIDSYVYCLNADDGSMLWNFSTGGPVCSSPAVVDGKVYIGSTDNNVYCLDAGDGSEVWSYPTGSQIYSSPSVVDGKAYLGSGDGNVYCLHVTDGSEVWIESVGGPLLSSPAVAYGNVYIGILSGGVICLDALSGSEQWNTPIGASISSPAIADNKVYIGSFDNKVYCLDASTGAEIWNYLTGNQIISSPALAEGAVYIGSDDGSIYTFVPNNPPEKPDTPSGPIEGIPGVEYLYTTSTSDQDEDNIFYWFEWGDGTNQNSGWIGPCPPDQIISTNISFNKGEDYELRVKAKDESYGMESEWSDPLLIHIYNEPPTAPEIIEAPSEAQVGSEIIFKVRSEDPEMHKIKIGVKWKEGMTKWNWFGPYESGEIAEINHTYSGAGQRIISFKARDIYGADNETVVTHVINIIKPQLTIGEIKGGAKFVTAEITNTGIDDIITDVTWSISIQGGILKLINISVNGTLDGLDKDETEIVNTEPSSVLGLGKATVTVTANAPKANMQTKTMDALVFLWFIFIIGEQ